MHITQRGNDRGAVFVDDADREHYLALLAATLRKREISLHAYVLMGNHVHLLMDSPRPGEISRALRRLGQCYAQSLNRRPRRTGSLWEGRFKSCLVSADRLLLHAIRYIELNPVRAQMVAAPEEYRWSSVHAHLGLGEDPLITCLPILEAPAAAR